MATSSLPDRITITVSTASGASCTIEALASGRVDQLHGAIERVLNIPTFLQNLTIACEGRSREIKSQELLSRLPLESCQNHLTVFNSCWRKDVEETVEKLKEASCSPTPRVAAAVAQCLAFEDSYVQAAALQALSWMGEAAKQHAPEIAEKLRMELPKRYRYGFYGFRLPPTALGQQRAVAITAAVALSWLEEAGAVFAADIILYGSWDHSERARDALTEMCQSESSATRLAAMKSLTSLLEKDGFGPVEHSELKRRRILLPYICDAVFDESPEVHQVAAACLMRFVPSFSGEADISAVRHTILDQLLRCGVSLHGKSFPKSVSIFYRALAAELARYYLFEPCKSQLFYERFLYLEYEDFREEDYLEECKKEWTAQWEDSLDSLMRDKHGGYLKSHATRRARHNKQHGANASQGPSTIARKKKWERRSKPAEVQDYMEIKKISQRDKEQDRQLKAAMLGRELFSFSLGLERESS